MQLYAICSPYLDVLKDEWFLPSLGDEFELRMTTAREHGGAFRSAAYGRAVLEKTDLIIGAIRENLGSCFVYSDVDVQFFRPVGALLLDAIEGCDIACQRDEPGPDGELCTGFFILRASARTLAFWRRLKAEVERDGVDQGAFNEAIRRPADAAHGGVGLKSRYLPDCFFGGGSLTGRQWTPGMELPVPPDVAVHHANWTIGVEHKVAQLAHVRDVVAARRCLARA